ncbi:hypothetical protein OC835_002835 [Tilletia horrida]|nr:hypothetical protein OC835_002835 [Tilletia horrida]
MTIGIGRAKLALKPTRAPRAFAAAAAVFEVAEEALVEDAVDFVEVLGVGVEDLDAHLAPTQLAPASQSALKRHAPPVRTGAHQYSVPHS